MTVGESPDAWRDHPRVCGEYQNVRFSDDWDGGSSPRMRGTRAVRAACGRAGGIIPAYAGNTSGYPYRRWRSWDHPRVCGEHKVDDSTGEGAWGSSPRMRGTHSRCRRAANVTGIIPAYAGNTMMTPRLTTATWDHPRVCGEHQCPANSAGTAGGSSPRMRGTLQTWLGGLVFRGIIPAYAGNTTNCWGCRNRSRDHPRICGEHVLSDEAFVRSQGSSPHMRGTRACRDHVLVASGIIPAYAGNTVRLTFAWPETWDHPRVCGEHARNAWNGVVGWGSSPRMRGTHAENRRRHNIQRIIPAYAGNTSWSRPRCTGRWDHPRVCGEHADCIVSCAADLGSSPRMRGTHFKLYVCFIHVGIIPAYAGNTWPLRMEARLSRDHPRICGEHSFVNRVHLLTGGSSPHMRGTHDRERSRVARGRIIPAYAGNTDEPLLRRRQGGDHPRICGEHIEYKVEGATSQGSSPHMRGTPGFSDTPNPQTGIIPAYAGNTRPTAWSAGC